MKMLSAWIGLIGAVVVAVGCGQLPQESSLATTSLTEQNVEFATWCRSWELQNCSATIESKTSAAVWGAGLETLAQTMKSTSRFEIVRADLSRDSVHKLLITFGGESLVGFLERLPWEHALVQGGKVVLQNRSAGGAISFQGLTLSGASLVTITHVSKARYAVTGLSASSVVTGDDERLLALDLAIPGAVSIKTGSGWIENIPLGFFAPNSGSGSAVPSAEQIIRALAAIVLDEELNWRSKIEIAWLSEEIRGITDAVAGALPSSPLDSGIDSILAGMTSLLLGGTGGNVLAISLNKALRCKMKMRNVPILGRATVDLNFSTGVGISTISAASGTIVAKLYGLGSNYGTVNEIEITEKQAKLRVGRMTIPLEYDAKGGPVTDSLVCE